MKINTLFAALLFFASSSFLLSQDTYHTNLQMELANDYNLPAANYVIANNEQSIWQAAYNWGSTSTNINVPGQSFSRSRLVSVGQAGNNPWDAGLFIQNTSNIQQGDVLLWTFYMRSTGGSSGLVSLVVEETVSGSYQKEFFTSIDVPEEWTRYFVAVEANLSNHNPGGLQIGFHLGSAAQVLEVGGFTVLNYGDSADLGDLPNTFDPANYDGSAMNAPWRATAADRIEQLRKADLAITTQTTAGVAVPNADVEVVMQRHEFAFGTAIKACRLGNNNCASLIFQDRLVNLDGEGHGFNWVVFENDLKWPAWEDEWLATNQEVIDAVAWLREREINIRGHVLVWPGWQNLPSDMQQNANNSSYLLERVQTHIETILNTPGLDGQITDWDVINETVSNTSLANALAGEPGYANGREVYAEIFEWAAENAPEAKLFHNDFTTLTLNNPPGSGPFNVLMTHLQELVDAGAPLQGIGIQGHIGGNLNGIPRVLATYDEFYNAFGLPAKITEFDLPPTIGEELAARYLDDFLTATFSHPSMEGFLFWNFWDVDTWQNPGANLFRTDWTMTPSGETFVNKLFNEWWTEEEVQTDEAGLVTVRGFKGLYELRYNCGGELITQRVDLSADTSLVLACDDFISSTNQPSLEAPFTISPNPSSGELRLEHPYGEGTQAELFNSLGQLVWSANLAAPTSYLRLDLPKGAYVLRLYQGDRWSRQRLLLE